MMDDRRNDLETAFSGMRTMSRRTKFVVAAAAFGMALTAIPDAFAGRQVHGGDVARMLTGRAFRNGNVAAAAVVRPRVIAADMQFPVSAPERAHECTSMAASVEKAVDFLVFIPRQQHRMPADMGGDEVMRIWYLGFKADENPGRLEYMSDLRFIDFRIDKRAAVDLEDMFRGPIVEVKIAGMIHSASATLHLPVKEEERLVELLGRDYFKRSFDINVSYSASPTGTVTKDHLVDCRLKGTGYNPVPVSVMFVKHGD